MNIFNTIQITKPKYNKFNLSHEVKLTLDFGMLVPYYVEPTLPGDKFKISSEFLCRMSALIGPVMHRINVMQYNVFCPTRLVWRDFREFITGGEDGTANPVSPRYRLTAEQANTYLRPGKLADYLGFAVLDYDSNYALPVVIDALPFRVYHKIFNELFRDQNLEDEHDADSDESGIIDLTDLMAEQILSVHRKAWQKDYFTSALPFAQRGEAVKIPVTGDVTLRSTAEGMSPNGALLDVEGLESMRGLVANRDNESRPRLQTNNGFGVQVSPLNYKGSISSISSTLNDLRRATKLQQWLERNAVGGARYIEQIFAHFGVKSSDARLQRPEYLGGTKTPVVISEVLQTSATDDVSPQGNQAGRAISVGNGRVARKFCEEHGYIMSFVCVVPKPGYFQGMPRKFLKFDKFDYYFPEFAHLGEQAVMNQELYWRPNSSDTENEGTFGYAPRYAEYRFNNDRVCGDFRSTLSFMHLARKFSTMPTLSKEFVQIRAYESDLNRIFAVEDNERYNMNQIWMQILVKSSAKRLIPKFATPSL